MRTYLILLAVLIILPMVAQAQQTHPAYDTNVNPWRVEAEDYSNIGVKADSTALGNKAVFCTTVIDTDGIPFPRTSRPITVYVRIKPGSNKETYWLYSSASRQKHISASVHPVKSGSWQWLRFSNISSDKAGYSFGLDYASDTSNFVTVIDSIVVSTQANLPDSQLNNAPLLYTGRPFAVAVKCSQPPAIDGKGNDQCWKDTIACTDFLLNDTETKAIGQTTVRFCYDDKNLYALFVCDEPILDPVVQRLHEFAAKIKDRDGDVMQNDCVAMIIKPNAASKDAYDFFANALGTINDAHCLTTDLWATRDSKWNMNTRALGSIDNGQWSLEIALPFADLSKKQPKAGDDWQVCIGRAALARNEISSWNQSFKGLHRPNKMGILRFGQTPSGIEIHMPDALEPGMNTIPISFSSPQDNPTGVYIASSVAGQSETTHSYNYAIPGKIKASDAEFQVRQAGNLNVAYGVLDAATCQPVYLTPSLTRTVSGSLSTISIKCDGPYELYLNGDLIAKGQSANGEPTRVSLRKGVNAFVAKLDKGTAELEISAPGIDDSKQNWKIAPPDAVDPVNPDTEDSNWKIAPVISGSLIGETGKPVILRRTVLIEKTLIWPTPLPAWYICKDTTQQLCINIGQIEHRKLSDWIIYVGIPAGLKMIGCTSYSDILDMRAVGKRKIDGRNMTVYKIMPKQLTRAPGSDQYSGALLFIKCLENIETDKASIVYWASANGGTVSELRHTVQVQVLPALNGRQPKKLLMVMCGMFSEITNPAMKEEIARIYKAAGFNTSLTEMVNQRFVLEKYGISNTTYLSFDGVYNRGIPKFYEYLKNHPDDRLIRLDGSSSDRNICTTTALDTSSETLKYMIKLLIGDCQTGSIIYDFEHPPFTGPHSCYCDRCLVAFKKYSSLPSDTKLDGAIIKDQYSKLWIDFIAYRNAQVFRRMKDIIHSMAPRMRFWVYSGYQSDDTIASYGVNWDYIGKLNACDVAGVGYGRPVAEIAATFKGLRGIKVIFGSLLIPYMAQDYSPSTQISKAEMLRRVLDSRGGILFWQRDSVDGRTWLASAETTRLMATYEDAFLNGKLSRIDNQDESSVQLLTNGNTRLLCIMNPSANQAEYRVRMPGINGKWKEFYTGRVVDARKTCTIKVQGNDTAVFIERK